MPIYEYRCRQCAVEFELLVRDGTEIVCPQCEGSSLDKLLPLPFIAIGQTARQPGHTCCGRDERCDRPACATGETCRHET